MNILESIYLDDEIFVTNPRFRAKEPVVTVTCAVPPKLGYTKHPVPYLTAENYVRILSQASYLLAHHVLEKELIAVDVSAGEFRRAMTAFELYYRNISMIFHKRTPRDSSFEMILRLKDWRVIKRLSDLILFTFQNERTVISGEMSFVYTP